MKTIYAVVEVYSNHTKQTKITNKREGVKLTKIYAALTGRQHALWDFVKQDFVFDSHTR